MNTHRILQLGFAAALAAAAGTALAADSFQAVVEARSAELRAHERPRGRGPEHRALVPTSFQQVATRNSAMLRAMEKTMAQRRGRPAAVATSFQEVVGAGSGAR